MEWPFRRFLKAFDAYQRRTLVDEWKARRAAHIAALFANCVALDVRVLTRRGWLSHDEVKVGDFTIGYNPDTDRNEWTEITEVHHTMTPVPTIRLSNGFWEIRTTPDHRWVTRQKLHAPNSYLPAEFRIAEDFDWGTYIVCSMPFDGEGLPISDDEAELIGWVLTDGCVMKHPQTKNGSPRKFNLWVYQAKPKQVEHLEAFMRRCFGCEKELAREPDEIPEQREYGVFYNNLPLYRWRLQTDYSLDLYRRAGLSINKHEGVVQFVLSLSPSQLQRFMEGAWQAEGVVQGKNGRGHSQKPGPIADALELGIYLLGLKPSRGKRSSRGMDRWTWGIPRMRAKWLKVDEPREEPVWCVTTTLGSWTAKNETSVFLTGNTNLDDEKNDRASIVARLEETYEDVIAKIWNGGPSEEEQQAEEAVMSSPFMRASKAATTRMEEQAKQLRMVKSAAAQIKQPRPFTMPGESAIGTLPA